MEMEDGLLTEVKAKEAELSGETDTSASHSDFPRVTIESPLLSLCHKPCESPAKGRSRRLGVSAAASSASCTRSSLGGGLFWKQFHVLEKFRKLDKVSLSESDR
ncbi:hypothetical protein JOQ06_022505, partial [Pogonophryne albipinna]